METHSHIHRFSMEQHGHMLKNHHIDHGNLWVFLWNTHVFSMTTLKTLEEIPCINHGNYMENPCHGCSMLDIIKAWPYSKIPFKLHGIMVLTMKNPGYSHGYPWIFPWIFYGTDHGFSMEFNGTLDHEYFMVSLWNIFVWVS